MSTGPWSGADLGADGTFTTSPRLRAHVYAAHSHCSGFPTPRACALLAYNTAETYAASWVEIRANIGQAASDVDSLVAMDFEVGAAEVAPEASQWMRFAVRYFHLGHSVYRRVRHLCLHRKYDANAEIQLRAKMLPALEFPPVEEAVAGFEIFETLFADDEQAT